MQLSLDRRRNSEVSKTTKEIRNGAAELKQNSLPMSALISEGMSRESEETNLVEIL